jgi:hypothetical protein
MIASSRLGIWTRVFVRPPVVRPGVYLYLICVLARDDRLASLIDKLERGVIVPATAAGLRLIRSKGKKRGGGYCVTWLKRTTPQRFFTLLAVFARVSAMVLSEVCYMFVCFLPRARDADVDAAGNWKECSDCTNMQI